MKTLLLLLAFQDDTAKAKELLEAAGKALKEAKAIRFEYASQWKGTVDQKCKVTFQRPNLGRLEIKAYDQEYLYILDGKTLWMYMPSSKQYMKMEQSEGIQNALGVGPLSNLYFSPATELLTDATDLKVKEEKLGEEKVSVISWKATEAEHRLWIDANKAVRKYELKMTVEDETYEQTIEYGKVEIDPKLEKDAFAFTPPKDATEFKQDDDPSGALIAVGEDAPDFEATDLEGKKVKLSDYKGKTVILNFWFYG
jgi:outer membrane lipoprotein-sorting protein